MSVASPSKRRVAPPLPGEAAAAVGAVDFLLLCGSLKTNKRTGWVNSGIALPESIADHLFRCSLSALLLGATAAEGQHAAAMALVHDLAEALVGDIVPGDPAWTPETKHAAEGEAMRVLVATLGAAHAEAGARLQALFDEYEAQESETARIVKDVDRVEMLLQAVEYERAQGADLAGFFDSVRGKVRDARVEAWAREVESRRPRRAAGEGPPALAHARPREVSWGALATAAVVGAAAGAGACLFLQTKSQR
jgi:putative hydrolase of HD superfamily